MQQIIGN